MGTTVVLTTKEAVAGRTTAGGKWIAAALLGTAAIHASQVSSHARIWVVAGLFFAALATVEVALSAALIFRPTLRVQRLVVAASLGAVACWAVSRTFGLPVSPTAVQVEAVGRADLIATLLELAAAAGAWIGIRKPTAAGLGSAVGLASIGLVLALTAVALTAPEHDHAPVHHRGPGHHVHGHHDHGH